MGSRGDAQITAWFWFWLLAPDLFGYVPAFLFGLIAGNPWPLLGWLLHISVDRLAGFGLRGEEGGQALI